MPLDLSQLLVAANLGIMLFFMVAVVPTIFAVLPPQWSAAYVRKFFPKYFFFLGLTTAGAAALASAGDMVLVRQIALWLCAGLFFLNGLWLTPRINQAKDSQQRITFKVLHGASVGSNLLQLLVFVWLLFPVGPTP